MSMVSLPSLQDMIDSISRERNLPKTAVQEALQEALLKGYERYRRTQQMDSNQFDEEYFDNFYVELDTEEEGFRVLANKTIVEAVDNSDHQIELKLVQEVAPEALIGDTVVLDVTPEQGDFGRMAAIQTKQVLAQKLRDQQRRLIQEEFQDLEGEILSARVLRFERQSVIMAVSSGLGQPDVEAELLKRDQLPNDNYRANATFRVALKRVSEGSHRGPQLLVSRADAGLVVELFSNEVPEIEDEVVRIVAVAREANPPSRSVGPRTKIAVDTLERDVDPVGACIGARGSRIQVVVNELRGEKIDVIRWSPDPATYIANALSPARVDEVRLMNPDDRQAHVLVPEDQLSLAIGKEGQNVRLAARLTGWKIDIKDSAKYDYEGEARKMEELAEARRLAAEEQAALEAEEMALAEEALSEVEDFPEAGTSEAAVGSEVGSVEQAAERAAVEMMDDEDAAATISAAVEAAPEAIAVADPAAAADVETAAPAETLSAETVGFDPEADSLSPDAAGGEAQ
ncbi:transcription termination factor NusA [Romeria aff. gracilis LEGE 07310]|uniref:Transcription termination/antitermination protein NusA n=1 Tax=Vasconcelosia minhoensis LEGE 07310 TaxID=915328 RepID=A0A8J7DCE7_9CYAN|nr:transcription termination factor NusA [Romeria gracilis]MBE9078817.1 transcription termination factor NusA [Romeria aff. gracilis LEGE 07310]